MSGRGREQSAGHVARVVGEGSPEITPRTGGAGAGSDPAGCRQAVRAARRSGPGDEVVGDGLSASTKAQMARRSHLIWGRGPGRESGQRRGVEGTGLRVRGALSGGRPAPGSGAPRRDGSAPAWRRALSEDPERSHRILPPGDRNKARGAPTVCWAWRSTDFREEAGSLQCGGGAAVS